MKCEGPVDDAERINFILAQIMRRFFATPGRKVRLPDVTTGQLRLLRILSCRDRPTMKELARMAGVTMPSVTELVDRMVESGLVSRMPDENDRRVVRVALTRKAKNVIRKWRQIRQERIDQLLRQLSPRSRKRLIDAFETIHEILDELER